MLRTAGQALIVRDTPLAVRVIRSYQLYLLLLPTIALVFIFQYVPMYGATIAFKNFKPHLGIIGSDWIGLRHFIRFFESPSFWRLIRNTALLSGYELLVGFPIPSSWRCR